MPPDATPLARLLAARIAATGPVTLADYMAECLGHPKYGYYMTRDPLGQRGDFTTAPEISQMFGELLGLALAQAWLDQGGPVPFVLAELGPGRGTLMADVLRATARVPGFHAGYRLHLVETSPVLRAAQAARLPGAIWHDSYATLPEGPLYLLANEFFDALPIRQFTRRGNGWAETVVGLQNGRLTPGMAAPLPLATLQNRLSDTAEGDVVETCAPAAGIVAGLGARIEAQGGAALIIDYGAGPSCGDTFQAMAAHGPTDPFAAPGLADLTAHVDFVALAAAAAPARASSVTPQGHFLDRLGIRQRAVALAARLTGEAHDSHLAALRRLTAPGEMGDLFKVIGLTPAAAPHLAGLDP